MTLNTMLLMLLMRTRAGHSAEPHNDMAATGTDALRRDNLALRQRIAELEQNLDRCLRGQELDGASPVRVDELGQHDQVHQEQQHLRERDLPPGTYKASCSECRLASQLVTCRCPQKASVASSTIATMSSNNLTGGWVIPFADEGRLAGQPQDYPGNADRGGIEPDTCESDLWEASTGPALPSELSGTRAICRIQGMEARDRRSAIRRQAARGGARQRVAWLRANNPAARS